MPSPLSPSIPTLPYCSFCARRQKICLPYTQRCVPVSHKVQTAWESTAMNIKPVYVFVRECIYTVCPMRVLSRDSDVCARMVNTTCTCLCVYVALPLCLQGQVSYASRASNLLVETRRWTINTFYWISDVLIDSSAQLNLLLGRSMPLLKIVPVHLTCFFYAVLLSTIENKSSYHAGLSFKIMKQLQTQKDDLKIIGCT